MKYVPFFLLCLSAISQGTEAPDRHSDFSDHNALMILVSSDPEAPTVDEIVETDFLPNLPRPLVGLEAETPLYTRALLPIRAEGDFKEYLSHYPHTARSKLERYIIVTYDRNSNLDNALVALVADPHVVAVFRMPPPPLFRFESGQGETTVGRELNKSGGILQYHLQSLNIPSLRALAGGWSLLGIIDTGLYTEHPDLKSFSGFGSVSGTYLGGNFLPAASYDFGNLGHGNPYLDANVDELELVPNNPSLPVFAHCDIDDQDGWMPVAVRAGHGTHVAGIAAANSMDSNGVEGVCKRCGIAMMKFSGHECISVGYPIVVEPHFTDPPVFPAFTSAVQIGAQVINMSFSLQPDPRDEFCTLNGGRTPVIRFA